MRSAAPAVTANPTGSCKTRWRDSGAVYKGCCAGLATERAYDGAIAQEHQRVVAPDSECAHSGQAAHRHGLVGIGVRPVAELAVAIPAPGPDGAVAEQRERVLVPGRDCDRARETADLDGDGESVVPPLPSWPASFHPQARSGPSLNSASEWASPPAIAVAPARPPTGAGRLESVTLPLPI